MRLIKPSPPPMRIEARGIKFPFIPVARHRAPQVTCACTNIDIGTYDAQVELAPPPHLARMDGRGICVDACLALEVSQLWQQGIATTGSCCGHNKVAGYIGVIEDHVPVMLALGYKVQPNPTRPGAQDSFVPKSIRRACA